MSRHPFFGSQDEGSVGVNTMRNALMYNHDVDDTPIRRAPAHGRSLLESPLAPRSGSSHQILTSLAAFEGSPIERRRDPAAGDGPPSPFDFRLGH